MIESSNKVLKSSDYRFCVAPMMEWTDRHCRVFHRLLSRRARLYTEMVTANAVLHGPRERLIGFDAREQPVAIQLGGCEPAAFGAGRENRGGFRLLRNQPQCRLPVRPGEERRLRRLPDA